MQTPSCSQNLLFILTKGFHRLLEKGDETLTHDPIRNKQRPEIPAAYLYALCTNGLQDTSEAEKCKDILVSMRNRRGLWDEMGYGIEDEAVGFYGLVPTAYALLALAQHALSSKNLDSLSVLLSACDTVYGTENNGTLVKADHNKSDVLNTNLLGAQALITVAMLLPSHSNRRAMYISLAERVIRKVLGYQSPRGFFPYHFESQAVPILYQAMVTAQLRQLLRYFSQPIMHLAVKQGADALRSFFSSAGSISWDKANNHDKRGALWAYTFALAAFGNDDPLTRPIYTRLTNSMSENLFVGVEGTNAVDPFYSAWMVFGLVWAQEAPACSVTMTPALVLRKICLLSEYATTYAAFIGKYCTHKARSLVFPCGTLENRKWK